jgi:hypothetical protein
VKPQQDSKYLAMYFNVLKRLGRAIIVTPMRHPTDAPTRKLLISLIVRYNATNTWVISPVSNMKLTKTHIVADNSEVNTRPGLISSLPA